MSLNIRSVRYIFGCVVLVAHFGTAAMYFFVGQRYLDSLEEVIQGMLTVAPVAAVYSVMFVKYVTSNPEVRASEQGSLMALDAFMVQLGILLAFGLTLIGGTLVLFEQGQVAAENVKLFTGIVDTLFGGYMAAIFGKLFPSEILE
jgi:hypothetical protein